MQAYAVTRAETDRKTPGTTHGETRGRSILKAVIWNSLGLAVMAAVGFAFTGSVSAGGAMAAINAVLGLASYFAYERVWARIAWGRHA